MSEQCGEFQGSQLLIAVVGRGPSLRNNKFGHLIDSIGFVVRLKRAATDPIHLGVRTDVVCSRSADHAPHWLFPDCVSWDWRAHWKKFSRHPKPSTGCSAVLCVPELLPAVTEVVLAGCDYLMHPDKRHPNCTWGHDSMGEHQAIMALGLKITDIKDIHAKVR